MFFPRIGLFCALLVGGIAHSKIAQAEHTFIAPSFAGFEYTFDGFNATAGGGVRLRDPADDSGGAGKSLLAASGAPLDLSAYADGRLVIQFATQEEHRCDTFLFELIDTAGNGGKWTFSTHGEGPGQLQTAVSQQTLGAPSEGVGDVSQFDLSQLDRFQIIGSYRVPAPFNVRFASIQARNNVPPPPPYPGYEANAAWRAVAAARIETIRKGNLVVHVVDANGTPLPKARVRVRQVQHEFGFGSAFRARRLRDNNPQFAMYKQKAAELFNLGVIESNLKWIGWSGEWGDWHTQEGAAAAIAWMESKGMIVRGHNLIWPGLEYLPTPVRNLVASAPLTAQQQSQLRSLIAGHFADLGSRFAGRIRSWDVVNEPRAIRDVMNALDEGDDAMITWFNQAAAADPLAKLYLNDYGILASSGGTNTYNQQVFADQLQALQDAGAPIDGAGMQAHFFDGELTGPVQLWKILDRYQAMGLNIQITEFDHTTKNEALQAAYLRDFFTAMFAHAGVSDILQWGFWEGSHWRPDAALYRQDWSIKPNGQAYLDLVYDEWWTNELTRADETGTATVRGFKGEYEVIIIWGGQGYKQDATIDSDGEEITVTLPIVLGDYNYDGEVNAADYTVWRDNVGARIPPGAGPDGSGNGFVNRDDYLVWRQAAYQ